MGLNQKFDLLLEKIKDYSFENMDEIETDESSKSRDHSHTEESSSTIDELQMSNSDQLTALRNGTEIDNALSAYTIKDEIAQANHKTSSKFENLSKENIKLSETIEFLEAEARIHQETLEMESKERMQKAAIVIQVEF